MAKDKEISLKQWFIKNFFSVAAVIVALVNIWLAYRLAPISQNIKDIEYKVLANETRIESNECEYQEFKTLIRDDIVHIKGRVDSLYNNLIR